MKVRVKALAVADLQAIADYGAAHWGLPRTRDFMGSLIDVVEALFEMPMPGRSRDGLMKGMRSVRHRGYLVFFVREDAGYVVLAFVSERQDLAAIEFADRMADQ